MGKHTHNFKLKSCLRIVTSLITLLFFALFIIIPSPVHTRTHTHNRATILYTPPRQVVMSSTKFSVPGLSPEVGTRLTEIIVQRALPEYESRVALQVIQHRCFPNWTPFLQSCLSKPISTVYAEHE